jgi:glycerophosphoryl diester phosphodiesterase
MRRPVVALIAASAALVGLGGAGTAQVPAGAAAAPHLPRAHSHNDYERGRPLYDAVEHGFASIEVDVALHRGELYVTHDERAIDPSRTLRSLYLDPLRELVRRQGGWLYDERRVPLQLLIDAKTEAEPTYRALASVLAEYDDVFTHWTPTSVHRGPVWAVVSGNRAVAAILADARRFASIDGRLDDDRSDASLAHMPLVSVDWEAPDLSTTEERLAWAARVVAQVHSEGRKVRFWGVPDNEEMWAALVGLGVDYIGTDDSAAFMAWLAQ